MTSLPLMTFRHAAAEPSAVGGETTARVRICAFEELPIGLGRAFAVNGRTIALFRTRKGAVFAVDNKCPHKGGPLADGMLAGDSIVCPLHTFRFEMSSGECDQPNICPVKTYAVELLNGDIYLTLSPGGD